MRNCVGLSPSFALLKLTHHSQVDMLLLRYKFANFGKETEPTKLVNQTDRARRGGYPNRESWEWWIPTHRERKEWWVIIQTER